MRRVARSEGALLRITQALFEPMHAPRVRRIIQTPLSLPDHIGPTAAELLRTTLARGTLRDLLRAGGWQRTQSIDGRTGRLWEQYPQIRLDFSAQTAALLLAITRQAPGNLTVRFESPTPADRWVRACLADLLIALNQPLPASVFADAPLCWLLGAAGMAESLEIPDAIDFAPLFEGAMPAWLTAAQPRLTRRWIHMERRKPTTRSLARMTRVGTAQSRVLTAFFKSADAAQRRDLCGFAVHAAADILAPRPPARWWIESLDAKGALSARQSAATAAGGFLTALATAARWHGEHGRARIFDDAYDEAQFLLAQWEPLGRAGFDMAARISRALADLPALLGESTEEAS